MRNTFSLIFIIFSAVTYSQTIDFQFANGTRASYNSADVKWTTHNGATLNLELKNGSTINYNTDDIVYYNFNAEPVLLTSVLSLPEYDTLCVGTASSPVSYTIKGYQLTNDLTIYAPTHFEVSSDATSGFGSNLTLSPSSGNLDAIVYVRFIPSSVMDDDSNPFAPLSSTELLTGSVSNFSLGAVSRNLSVSGTGHKSGKWIGPSSGNWVNAANWCGGVPNSNTNVFIKDVNVTIDNNASCKTLLLDSATLLGGVSTLSVYGNFINLGGTFHPQAGKVELRGNFSQQNIQGGSFDKMNFYNLTINKSSGIVYTFDGFTVNNNFILASDSLLALPTATLRFLGGANFNNKAVILMSDTLGTASVATLPNDGNNLIGATKFTVERYIPANQKWRGLCMPLSSATVGNSIYNSWQNNGNVISDQGVLLWSPTSLPGFSLNTNTGASQNIRKYIGGSGFSLLSGTNEPLFSGGKPIPYLVFVTDYYKKGTNVGNMGTGASSTMLRATGSLFKGNYNSGTLGAGFHMIPNPYPCAIDFDKVTITGDLDNQFWIWDPKLEGFRGFGGYQTYSSDVLVPDGGSFLGSSKKSLIPVGAAFWVNSNGSGAIQMNESSKDKNINLSVFGRIAQNSNQILRINLLNESGNLLDGVAAVFNSNALLGNDKMDALKFGLGDENIFIRSNDKNLAIEFHPLVQFADTFNVVLNALSQKTYYLQISGKDIVVDPNIIAVLEDQYLKKETVLNLNDINKVEFTVDAHPASSSNRFRVVFRQNAITSINTLEADKGFSIYPNPAIKGQSIQLSFNNQPAGMYRLVLYDIAGVQVMNRVLQYNGGTAVQSLELTDKIFNGLYVAELTDAKGNAKQIKITVQ